MAEAWPGFSLASLQVPVLLSDKRAQNKLKHHHACYPLPRKPTRQQQQQQKETRKVENTRATRTHRKFFPSRIILDQNLPSCQLDHKATEFHSFYTSVMSTCK